MCFLLTFGLKAVFGSFRLTLFGHVFNASSFPSGHVAHATAFYGGLAMLVAAAWRGRTGRLVAAALALLVALIAAAVFVLWWHHTLDIVFGFLVGGASLWVMRSVGLARPRGPVQLAAILGVAALLVGATHGMRLDDHIRPFRFASFLTSH